MPGVGRLAPNRNKAIRPSVIRSFLRRSGVWNARTKAVSMRSPRFGKSSSPRILPGTAPVVVPGSAEPGDRAAGLLDLPGGRGRERVRGDPQRDAEVAAAEHLDQLAPARRAPGHQRVR